MNRFLQKAALLLAIALSVFEMRANPVDMNTARGVAVKFMNANTQTSLRGTDDLQLVTTYNISRGDAAFYVFNTPRGFVIVSADDCATPILGYSKESRFDREDVPIQLQDYLQDFVEQIQYGIENHLEADEATARQWELVRTVGHLSGQRATTVVEPLITSNWDQGCYYNAKCPEDPNGYCGHVLTGCAATSLAQIMHYWGYPVTGMGSHTYTPTGYPEQTANFGATTYDWAHMPNSLSSSSTSTEIDAVATLMWHCGVAINMQYSPSGSGASPNSIPYAIKYYFGYSHELSLVYKSDYSDEDWLALMKTCLDVGRPIHYSGWDANTGGGHGFVCDGYDANNLLHFNWGWGGNHNGYFSIDAMNPSHYVFTSDNMAIVNIHPGCTPGTTYQITATADPSNGGTISGSGTYSCGHVCTLTATAIGDYTFMYWTEDGEQVSSEATYSFMAVEDRNLVAHFALPFTITTSAHPAEGGTVSGGGVCHYNQQITLTATPNEGYVFNKWTKNGEVFSYLSTLNLTVTEAAEYVAYFEQMEGIVIGDGSHANVYLPAYYYNSLTQQIYTASEMGGASTEISSVSFFNIYQYSSNRNWNVYLVHTDKTSFESASDWIPVSESDLVYSGYITMDAHSWTTIYFSTPFLYDGSSNVALIIDDNTNSYSYLRCRAFGTEPQQAICVYGDYNSDYDPYNTTDYTGTRVTMKNQVVFGIPSFDFTVTATVGPEGGGTVSGGGLCYLNQPITLTATPNEGYAFKNWTKNGSAASYLSTLHLEVMESADYVAHFQKIDGIVIGDAACTTTSLPAYSRSSLSQQIYTADELNMEAGEICSVSFFNMGNTSTFSNWDVYMANTDKASYDSTTDWIPVSEADLVFSGSVTCTGYGWATICFSTPFVYDGSSNVVLVVNHNTSSYSSVLFRAFRPVENQAILVYNNSIITNYNYDPFNPSSYTGTLMTMKNQVVFHQPKTITASATPIEGGVVSGGGIYAYGTTCTLAATPNAGYYFLNWTEDGEAVSYDASYSFTVDGDRNLVANFVEGESTCTIFFDLYDTFGNGWSGNYLVVDYGNGNSEQLTLGSGSSISYSREVATGSTLGLSWIKGTYTYQCSFDIKFENGVLIYRKSDLNNNFHQELYVNCAVADLPLTITTVARPLDGGTIEGAGAYEGGTIATLTATPNEGYLFLHWRKNGEVVSCNATYDFVVTENAEIQAVFMHLDGRLIGEGEETNSCLPSYSYWKYNLSQQIYTPEEIGEAGYITSISYFNAGYTQTRNFDIYMVYTDKTAFNNSTDWIAVSEEDRVYSGSVTMTKGYWTTIVLNMPFAYNGTSNLAVIIDDNTGGWSNSMACRVFDANGYQAIQVSGGDTNYDPYNPSVYGGIRYTVKNQMILGITAPITQTIELTEGWNWISTYIDGRPANLLQMLQNGLGDNGVQIESVVDGVNMNAGGDWAGDLDNIGLKNEHMYLIEVTEDVTVELQGPAADPTAHPITIYPNDWSWIGYPCAEEVEVNVALSGFEAEEGDMIETLYGEEAGVIYYYDGEWVGDFDTMIPGRGYLYFSNSSEEKTLFFQTGEWDKAMVNSKR